MRKTDDDPLVRLVSDVAQREHWDTVLRRIREEESAGWSNGSGFACCVNWQRGLEHGAIDRWLAAPVVSMPRMFASLADSLFATRGVLFDRGKGTTELLDLGVNLSADRQAAIVEGQGRPSFDRAEARPFDQVANCRCRARKVAI